MSSSNQYIESLRNKPQSTKNAIAAVFALIPALLVGYAQFYMNANTKEVKVAATPETSQFDEKQAVSAMASIGKIFSEGKATIGDALNNLDKIDSEVLKKNGVTEENIKKLMTEENQPSTNTKIMIDDSAIKNAVE